MSRCVRRRAGGLAVGCFHFCDSVLGFLKSMHVLFYSGQSMPSAPVAVLLRTRMFVARLVSRELRARASSGAAVRSRVAVSVGCSYRGLLLCRDQRPLGRRIRACANHSTGPQFVRCVLRMGLERRLGHAAVEVFVQTRGSVGLLPGGAPRLALINKHFSCRSGSRGHTEIEGLCNYGPLPAAVWEVPWVALDASLRSSLVRPHTHTILAY